MNKYDVREMYYDVLQKTPIKKPTQAIVILIFQWITTGITIEIAYPQEVLYCSIFIFTCIFLWTIARLVHPRWYFQIFITNLAKTLMSWCAWCISRITFISCAPSQKIGNPNNFKIFWNKNIKWPQQRNWSSLSMYEI